MSIKSLPKKRKIGEVDELLASSFSPNGIITQKPRANVTPSEISPSTSTPLPRTAEYLLEMETELATTPKIYNEFLKVMKLFKNQGLPVSEVVIRVKLLLKEHDKLWKGFQDFLPDGEGHQLDLSEEK